MSNYYAMQSGKVAIAHALMNRGWKIYGYHADESDSMTDYFDPAWWHGIATKNGYILVIDENRDHKEEEIKQYNPKGNISSIDRDRTEKLKNMTVARGCTEEEADTAKKILDNILSKTDKNEKYIVTGTIPAYMGNPGKCKWHIEKDGKIYDKGTGITKYADLPKEYSFDMETMKYKPGYEYWDSYGYEKPRKRELSDKERKNILDFKNLILKFEQIANDMNGMGDGTAETAKKAAEQERIAAMQKVTVTEYKDVNKTEVISGYIEEGMDFILNKSFNHGCSSGSVYHITSVRDGRVYAEKYNGKLNKLCNGIASANNHINFILAKMQKWIADGSISLVKIVTVKTPYQVEKWVRQEVAKPSKTVLEDHTEPNHEQVSGWTYDIQKDVDTRDNSEIYVVKIIEKLSKEEYIKANIAMKNIGGYYSRFKHGFIFKEDPSALLNSCKADSSSENSSAGQKEKTNQPSNSQKAIDKIRKQLESLQKNIDGLSGDHLTNTRKRMNEQNGRNQKIERYQFDMDILNYLLNVAEDGDLTTLEENILVSAFRDEMYSYSAKQKAGYGKIAYPVINTTFPVDGWWNMEVPKMQKRLNRAGITNTTELIEAIKQYDKICQEAVKPIDKTAQQIKKLESEYKMQQKGDINFTPQEVAEQLIKHARIGKNSRVLEPSAGIGSLADAIRKVTDKIDIVEQMFGFRELLKLKGYNLVGDDFLEYETENLYDAIIMNPPFSDEQRHIKHAFDLLKAGGTLVSITSPHWTFAKDKNSLSFNDWLDDKTNYTIDLPSGTFEMTGVSSKILVIEKAANEQQRTAS